MSMKTTLTKDRLVRALRMCKCTKDAALMLGCNPETFKKRLKEEGLETPWRKGAPSSFHQQERRRMG